MSSDISNYNTITQIEVEKKPHGTLFTGWNFGHPFVGHEPLTQRQYHAFDDTESNVTQYSAAPPRTYGITFTEHFGVAKAPM